MARKKKQSTKKSLVPPAGLQGMIDSAVTGGADLIITTELDPDTGFRRLCVFLGNYVSPCMLRKLAGLAESQADEGCRMISGDWV